MLVLPCLNLYMGHSCCLLRTWPTSCQDPKQTRQPYGLQRSKPFIYNSMDHWRRHFAAAKIRWSAIRVAGSVQLQQKVFPIQTTTVSFTKCFDGSGSPCRPAALIEDGPLPVCYCYRMCARVLDMNHYRKWSWHGGLTWGSSNTKFDFQSGVQFRLWLYRLDIHIWHRCIYTFIWYM